jgi:hypothetical protein
MDAAALTPRALFDGNICYEVPPFQRPYVWNLEDQWQPLWDDIERVTNALIAAREAGDPGESLSHFLGAVVLKQAHSPAGDVARRSVVDGQQRLTTLQLLMDAAQLVLGEHGDEGDAESIQELVFNSAKRFHGTPSRFKLWPSRTDRHAFEYVMDDDLTVTPQAAASRIHNAHAFFASAVQDWADVDGDPEKARQRLSVLADVLQQRLRIVTINLSASDDDQLIFETLNGRGTPLLAADHIKNYLFQQCEQLGADVDTWSEVYWQDFDDEWWRDQVAQGRLYRSRIDLFLQYWLTMKMRDEIPTEELFARFRAFAAPELQSSAAAAAFLRSLRHDADTYRDLVTKEGSSPAAGFYARVVEDLESGSFIPLLLWVASDAHTIPEPQVQKALDAVESVAIRRTLLRMTTKDFNGLVVSTLKALDGTPDDQAGDTIVDFLARQAADSRSWPTDDALREQLPDIRLYGNVKQSRLRMILSALELRYRTSRNEDVPLPAKLEIEHVMPRGWKTHWADDIKGDPERAAHRDLVVDTLGNLTLVTKKLNGTLSNRPWRDADAAAIASTVPAAGQGKRSLLNRYSLLVLNKDIVEFHEGSWTEEDIRERSRQLVETVISVWPRPAEPPKP